MAQGYSDNSAYPQDDELDPESSANNGSANSNSTASSGYGSSASQAQSQSPYSMTPNNPYMPAPYSSLGPTYGGTTYGTTPSTTDPTAGGSTGTYSTAPTSGTYAPATSSGVTGTTPPAGVGSTSGTMTPQPYNAQSTSAVTSATDPYLPATGGGAAPAADYNPDGTLKSGIDSATQLPYGNVPGYAPGGSINTNAPAMYNSMTGQEDYNPADFAAITAYNQQQNAANGQTQAPTYTDVPQIAGQDPQAYINQLAAANPNASPTQLSGIQALASQSGSTVPPPPPATTSPASATAPGASTTTVGAMPPNVQSLLGAMGTAGTTSATGSTPAPYTPLATPAGVGTVAAGTSVLPASQAGTMGTAQVSGNNLLQDYQSQLQNLSQGNLAGAPGVDTNQILSGLLSGSNALQGPTSQTQSAINNLLANPSAYNSAAVQQTYNTLGQQIDDQYALQQQQLVNNMAARGLSDSSIAGGKLSDLNIGQRSAKEQLAASLATQQAQDLSQATQAAINLGLSGSGQQQTASAQNYAQQLQGLGFNQNNATTNTQLQQQILAAIMGYGQQGFNNDVTTQQLNNQQQQEQDQLQLQLLGLA